jgi:hypothetical protein
MTLIGKRKAINHKGHEGTRRKSGHLAIGTSGHRKSNSKTLPRMNADDDGSEKQISPQMNTDHTDQNQGSEKREPKAKG